MRLPKNEMLANIYDPGSILDRVLCDFVVITVITVIILSAQQGVSPSSQGAQWF